MQEIQAFGSALSQVIASDRLEAALYLAGIVLSFLALMALLGWWAQGGDQEKEEE